MKHQSIKVKFLREEDYDGLDKWMNVDDNIHVGRRGRVFIHRDGQKKVYHYQESKWRNPFNVSVYRTLDESLTLYVDHLYDTDLICDIYELEDKVLGCYCDPFKPCHAKVLCHLLDSSKYPNMKKYVEC